MKKVLVTDAQTRLALYAIRSLGEKGHLVHGLVDRRFNPRLGFGTNSKYLQKLLVWDTAERPEEEQAKELAELARGYDVLLPINTLTIMLVAGHSQLFQDVGIFLPDFDKIAFIQNKANLCKHAAKLGIPIPRTYFPKNTQDLRGLIQRIQFPVYLKRCEEKEYGPRERYRLAASPEQLLAGYLDLTKKHEELILQEKIEGKIIGYFGFFDENSKEIAWFNHRRIRQYPYEGGPSSYCESHYSALATSYGRRLLQSLNWKGLAMVEFVMGESEKELKLLEVNPRLWGSTPLAINAGVDFPYIWFQKSLGLPVKKIPDYRTGIRVRFLPKDLMAIAAEVKHDGRKIKLLLSGLLDLLDPRVRDGVILMKDLKPAIGYIGRFFENKDETI